MFRRRDEERERLFGALIDAHENQIAVLSDLLADSNAKIESLLEAHRTLMEAHRELQNAEQKLIASAQMPTFSNEPLYYSEEEEDAMFAPGQPEVDTGLMKEILGAAGFPNTEVELDPA
jgi:hypothetical protein